VLAGLACPDKLSYNLIEPIAGQPIAGQQPKELVVPGCRPALAGAASRSEAATAVLNRKTLRNFAAGRQSSRLVCKTQMKSKIVLAADLRKVMRTTMTKEHDVPPLWDDYNEFRDQVIADIEPGDVLERVLIDEYVHHAWELLRVRVLRANLITGKLKGCAKF
jgi:hypothetical protein